VQDLGQVDGDGHKQQASQDGCDTRLGDKQASQPLVV
jgi:hypothetical protein